MTKHDQSKAWAKSGLKRIKSLRRIDELQIQHTGFTEFEQDPRRQMSWNNFFTKFSGKRHNDDDMHFDGGIKPFAPFA